MGRARNLIHKSKASDFAQWLEQNGWTREKPKVPFEVIRVRREGLIVIFHERVKGEHLTTWGDGYNLARKYIREKRRRKERLRLEAAAHQGMADNT